MGHQQIQSSCITWIYPPHADTYHNALHVIPAPDGHDGISDGRHYEAGMGQLKNEEVITIYSISGSEGV
jgi:hypothetical protein